jgi:hypothetical protein
MSPVYQELAKKTTLAHKIESHLLKCNQLPPFLASEDPQKIIHAITNPEKSPQNRNILELIIERGKFDDLPETIDKHDLLQFQNNKGQTALHLAAKTNTFNELPHRFITEKVIEITDNEGNNCVHILAQKENLPDIIHTTLSKKILLEKNQQSLTPLQYAAASRGLHNIPQSLLNSLEVSAWVEPDCSNITAFTYACCSGYLRNLPPKLFEAPEIIKELLKKNPKNVKSNLEQIEANIYALPIENLVNNPKIEKLLATPFFCKILQSTTWGKQFQIQHTIKTQGTEALVSLFPQYPKPTINDTKTNRQWYEKTLKLFIRAKLEIKQNAY